MPREMTRDEVQAEFLAHVHSLVDYWLNEERRPDTRDKLEGLAFSILAALDGSAGMLPSFVVAPSPHEDDKAYQKAQGENWYPEAPDVACDIAGDLHERWHRPTPVIAARSE